MALLKVDAVGAHLFGDQCGLAKIVADLLDLPFRENVSLLPVKGVNGNQPGKTRAALLAGMGNLEQDEGLGVDSLHLFHQPF